MTRGGVSLILYYFLNLPLPQCVLYCDCEIRPHLTYGGGILSLRFEKLCISSGIPMSDAPAIATDLHRAGEVR